MDVRKILKALKDHAREEVRIHREVFTGAKADIKKLASKHVRDTMSIHKEFWSELKAAVKSRK